MVVGPVRTPRPLGYTRRPAEQSTTVIMVSPLPPSLELLDDIIEEILLRLPPDDPALLIDASLVCMSWRRLLTDPVFLHRYRAFHRTPPLLGFLHNIKYHLKLVSITSFHPRKPEYRYGYVLDCRHGRILHQDRATLDLLVWDPITAEEHRIPGHDDASDSNFSAAVLCAVANCDHRNCHGSPFLVALISASSFGPEEFTNALFYSSETGEWSAPTTVEEYYHFRPQLPPALAGDTVYFICDHESVILGYDLHGERGLSMIDVPRVACCGIALIPTLDGGLRLAGLNDCYSLDLWSLERIGPEGVPGWTHLMKLSIEFPVADDFDEYCVYLVGSKGPDPNVIFVRTQDCIFMIDLESPKARKVYQFNSTYRRYPIFPYTGFFTPDLTVGRLPSPEESQ